MNTWFTSDNHFGHNNIIKYCKRPYQNVDEMDDRMIKNWNSVVHTSDIVYLLGDFCWYKDVEKAVSIISCLNGIKHFVFGNHDETIHKIHDNYDYDRSVVAFSPISLFESYSSYKEIKLNKQPIVLCHYAMRVWNDLMHGSWMLFGHTHNTLAPYGKSVDVGVDSTAITGKAEYRPFSFEEIKTFMDKQPIVQHLTDKSVIDIFSRF